MAEHTNSNGSREDSKFMNVVNGVGNAIMMNLLFLISCLPVVTIGQAWCGLYGAVRFRIRGDSWVQGFKEGFCTRFLRGAVAWTALLALTAFLAFQTYSIWFYKVPGFWLPLAVSGVFLLLTMLLSAALPPLNVYVPTGVGDWLRNGITLVFTAPLRTLGAATILWLPVALALLWPMAALATLMIFVAAYFSLGAIGCTLLMKKPLLRVENEGKDRGEE